MSTEAIGLQPVNPGEKQMESTSVSRDPAAETPATDTDSVSSMEDLNKGTADGLKSASTKKPSESSSLLKSDSSDAKRRSLVGIGLAVLFATSMTLSIPCLQLLGPETVRPLQLLFFAFLAHFLLVMPVWFYRWKKLSTLDWGEVMWLVFAAVANGLSTATFYLSAESLPSGVVGAVGEGSMLIISVIITAAIDAHVALLVVIATFTCAIGLIFYLTSVVWYDPVVVKVPPGFNATEDGILEETEEVVPVHGLMKFHPSVSYIVLVLSSLLLIAANVIIHRKFAKVSFSKLLLFFPTVGLVIVTIAMFAFGTPSWDFELKTADKYLPFTGFLVLFVISSISLYACWMRTSPPIFALITSGSLVLLLVLQYTISVPGIEPGRLDALEIIGALLILLANVIGPLSELELSPCQRWLEERGYLK